MYVLRGSSGANLWLCLDGGSQSGAIACPIFEIRSNVKICPAIIYTLLVVVM